MERVLLEPNPTASPAEAGSHPRPKRAVGVLAMAGSGTSPLRLVIQVGMERACQGVVPACLITLSGLRERCSAFCILHAGVRAHTNAPCPLPS